jgi:hypothetical protein
MLLGLAGAFLIAAAPASHALTAGETAIDRSVKRLFPGKTLTTASVEQLRTATLDALKTAPQNNTLSLIVSGSLARIPQFANDVSGAALARLYANGASAVKNNLASGVVKTAMTKGLGTYNVPRKPKLPNGNKYKGVNPTGFVNGVTAVLNPSDIAAAIAFVSVDATKNVRGFTGSLTPMQTIVKSAVLAGLNIGGTTNFRNASAGAVAGFIFGTAGVGNDNLAASTPANRLVKAILTAATQAAGDRRLNLISEAAGFAFARAYLGGGLPDSTLTSLPNFISRNAAQIQAALRAGLPARIRNNARLGASILSFVKSGMTKAYQPNTARGRQSSGFNGIAFNNKVATAVTPITPR